MMNQNVMRAFKRFCDKYTTAGDIIEFDSFSDKCVVTATCNDAGQVTYQEVAT